MQVDQPIENEFIENGFVHLREVVAPDVVAAGQTIIWSDLAQSADDPSSWTGPVARIIPSDARPFKVAFDSPLLFDAFDRLVGRGRWMARPHLGYFVVRFPHPADPGDTGWHIDSSFPPDADAVADGDAGDFSQWRVNVSSRGRALLMLFLFSDVGPDDAPTRIKVGSHLDVPSLLRAAGADGMTGTEASALAARASGSRTTAFATGAAGDVYLCHPFLVHAAQPVRGGAPRLLAQPPLTTREALVLDRSDGAYSPVEQAISRALDKGA